MRQPELDVILSAMLDTHPGISDLVFSVGRPLQVESYGELKEAHIAQPNCCWYDTSPPNERELMSIGTDS